MSDAASTPAPAPAPEGLYADFAAAAAGYESAKAALYATIPAGSVRLFKTPGGVRAVYAYKSSDGRVRYTEPSVIGLHDVSGVLA